EAAGVRGTVVLRREPDSAHAVEDALEADPCFGAGERTAGAGVRAPPDRDVVHGVGPVDAALLRTVEPPRIAVVGAVEQDDRRTRRDFDAGDVRGTASETE